MNRLRRAGPKRRSSELAASPAHLAIYLASAPSPQNAVDIFRGEWTCSLPEPLDGVTAGAMDLFHDPRIDWCGVLYHMEDPVELIALLAPRCSEHVFI